MQIIPLAAVAAQTLKVVLGQQNCVLNVYQKSTGMYLDVILEGETILAGVLCRDRVRCVRQAYLGFIGDLAFMDTEGTDDPVYSGLGSRWVLMYLSPEDLIEKTTSTSIDFQTRINAANAWASAHPLVLTGALDNGMQGSPYSSAITVQGQMPGSSLSWSVVGSLPAGLALDRSTGIVSGTPTSGLTIISFTLKVKDNLGRSTTSAQTVKIGQTFAMATSLPGIMSLTRASIGTYFDPTATMQTAANNQARFDYNPLTLALRGLLLEEQRTNLAAVSNGSGLLTPTRATWVDTGQKFIDGSTPMYLLREDTTASSSHFGAPSFRSLAANTAYAMYYIVKAAGRTKVALFTQGNSLWSPANPQATFDLAAGTFTVANGAKAFMTNQGNGFWRIGFVATMGDTAGLSNIYPSLVGANNSAIYDGDGVSGMFIGGLQIEAGTFPTSYIPTTSATVTRAADVASITVPSGFTTLTYDYDDGTSLQETVSAGAHTIPTPVAPKRIKTISVTA